MAAHRPARHRTRSVVNDELLHVAPENRNIFQEIFMNDDSGDEFDGFENNPDVVNAENDDGSDSDSENESEFFADAKWRNGDRVNSVKSDVPQDPSALDFVSLFLENNFFDVLTVETNRYATQYLAAHALPPHSRYHKWPPAGVSVDDMKCFIAVITAMGLVQQEDLQDYWSLDDVIQTPFFPATMSRDFFLNILSFFHLADNHNFIPRGQEGYNPLHKLGTVYSDVLDTFSRLYYPSQNLCIDEAMIPYRGKIHMRVYAKDKPCRYGLKAYALCDSENAYCLRFQLYTGKANQLPSQLGRTYDIVSDLMAPYLNKGHILYTDNYYSSPVIAKHLVDHGTNTTGTVRVNRKGIPKRVKEAKVKQKGEKITMSNGPYTVTKLHDSKVVTLLSTVHSSKSVATGKHDHHGNPVMKLEMQHQYNR